MLQKRPVHEIRLGAIRAAIWANQNGTAEAWFNVTVTRLYKNGAVWSHSSAFGRDDLPLAAKALEMAYAWIWEHQATCRPEKTSVANGQSTPAT